MALDFPVGTDFPANGNQIPDGEIYEGFYWDAATNAWKRLCERDKIGDCLNDNEGETVCDRLEILDNQIIELEEEIDAIATSVGRGTWEWDFNVSNYLDARLGRGKFYMVRDSDLAIVTDYQDCGRIVFHEEDMEGDTHTFDDTMVDKVLMLFDRPDDDFLESVITAVETTSGTQGTAYIIHVDHKQSKGSPTNAPDGDGKYKARLNIFDQPSGGTVGEYVLKAGDTIPCDNSPISFPNTYTDNSLKTSVSSVQAYVKFTSKNTNDNSVQTTNIFQPGNTNAIMTNGKLFSKQDLYSQGLKGFKNDLYTKSTIDVSTDSGYLKHNDDTRLGWHVNGGSLYHTTNIFGWTATHSLAYKPIQFTDISTNTDDNHAIHKGYVDDKIEELLARIEELEMAGGVPRSYHFEQVQVREGYNWNGYSTALWLWGDEWDQSSTQPGTSSRKLQIQLPNNNDGSPKWLIKPQGHIVINDFEQYYDQRKVGSIIFYPGKIEVKEYAKSYGPQTYYEITGDFAPTESQYSKYWSRESRVRMTFVGGSVEEVPTP